MGSYGYGKMVAVDVRGVEGVGVKGAMCRSREEMGRCGKAGQRLQEEQKGK